MTENSPQDRRRHERYPIYCPIEFKAEDEQPKEPSMTLNVSEGGALISAKRDLSAFSSLIIKLKLRDELFFLLGKVKHVRQDGNNDTYEVGLEFWDRPKTFTKKLYEELDGIKNYQKKYREEQGSEISLPEASLNWYKDAGDI